MEILGIVSDRVIDLLGLTNISDTNIYIGQTNIDHMKSSHPEDYEKYGSYIRSIILHPDYIGKNQKNDSIEYVKEFYVETESEYVKVAVRVTGSNKYFARTLYVLNRRRVIKFIRKGTLLPYDTNMHLTNKNN